MVLKNNEMLQKLNELKSAIKTFNFVFKGKKFKIFTYNEKPYVVSFYEKDFLNITNLDTAIRQSSKNKKTEKTFKRILKKIKYSTDLKINSESFENAVINAPFISSKVRFNLNRVHSLIDLSDKKYILVKSQKEVFAIEIIQENEYDNIEYYRVKDVISAKELNGKFLLSDLKVDFPYRIEQIIYEDDGEHKISDSLLPDKIYEERINMLREYVYFDSNENDRKDDDYLDISELVKRVPIKK